MITLSPAVRATTQPGPTLSRQDARPATVVALTAHARGVPSAARESFAAACEALPPSDAVIVVHTCHRVELYVALHAYAGPELPTLPAGGRRLQDAAAVRHLISVTCGLESAVLGEDQVLHQVRETFVARRASGPLHPVLDRLFQVSLSSGRRARGWFAGSRRSLGDAALDEIERRIGSLRDRPLLVVGAGSMGRLAARAAARRGARLVLVNRTHDNAAALARDLGGSAVARVSDGSLPAVAGAIVAMSGLWAAHPDDVRRLVDGDAPVIDLSSPPAVDDALQSQLGERFVSIDDLAWGEQVDLPGGLRGRLEQLVTETGADFCRWLRSRGTVPAVQALTEAAERRRQSELAWLMRRMTGLSDEDRALVEQMSHRLVAGILHAPRAALRVDDTGDLGRAAWELFGL
jgi:glutamyl-tRNA reductase